MPTDYFPCYHSYLRKCEKLTDQELGRLFRALMKYSATGKRQELAGRESIAFDFIADDIDRAKNAYEEKCRQNRENATRTASGQGRSVQDTSDGQRPPADGSDGQRPLADGSDGQRPLADGSDGQRPPATASDRYQIKSKRKRKNKSTTRELSPLVPPSSETGFGPELQAAFAEWLNYKQERRETYQPTGLKSLIAKIQSSAEQYGEAALVELIQNCMASNWQGIIFDRLKNQPPLRTNSGNLNAMEDLRTLHQMFREEEMP